MDKEIAIFVKSSREKLNLSQEEFAKKLDISRVALSSLETGDRNLRAEEYIRIKQILKEKGAELDYLRTSLE